MKSNRQYYMRYIADVGARVYKESRSLCHAVDFRKYSSDFLEQLPEAIISKPNKPREYLRSCISDK